MCRSSTANADQTAVAARRVPSWLLGAPLLLLAACGPEDSLDWCLERQDPDTVPATGSLIISYDGRFAKGPVNIEAHVKNVLRAGVITKGCGTDEDGTLWRFFGGWSIPEGTPPEQPLVSDPNGVNLSGDFVVCKGGSCRGGETRIVGFRESWEGTVHSFDLDGGSLAAEAFSEDGFGVEVRVQADLSWPPMSP
ncbi:MAG: hypothetical protein RL685_1136 [Pseudomonadota bacterium]|jgi:hypothetical protein